MKYLNLVVFIIVFGAAIGQNVTFEKPQGLVYPSDIPNLFESRIRLQELQRYPLAREAVLSVALKLQALEGRGGKPRNFLVSPLAVAGALGQLMLGAKGDLRRQLAVLLTLRPLPQNGSHVDQVTTEPHQLQTRFGEDSAGQKNKSVPHIATKITANNIWAYQPQDRKTLPSSNKRDDGIPGLELHYQLGGLIQALSMPIPESGAPHPLKNSSYLHTSSAFFMDRNLVLDEQFARAVKDYYDTSLIPLNFREAPDKAQAYINSWGSNATGGLIDQFLKFPPSPDTAVIQAVTVHFRGAWQTPFLPEATITGAFRTSENTTSEVKFMRGSMEDVPYGESKQLGLRLVVLPYSNFDCGMYIILPTETHPLKYDIGQIMSQLKPKDLADLLGMTKRRTVNIMFPKLKLTSSVSMAAALREHADFLTRQDEEERNRSAAFNIDPFQQRTMQAPVMIGLRSGANGGEAAANHGQRTSQSGSEARNASLGRQQRFRHSARKREAESSESSASKPMILENAAAGTMFRISDVVQQIALEVNEAGTEAAAIAGSTINYSGDVKNFRVNRPFLFFLRQEETNALLFWGTIVDPTT